MNIDRKEYLEYVKQNNKCLKKKANPACPVVKGVGKYRDRSDTCFYAFTRKDFTDFELEFMDCAFARDKICYCMKDRLEFIK